MAISLEGLEEALFNSFPVRHVGGGAGHYAVAKIKEAVIAATGR